MLSSNWQCCVIAAIPKDEAQKNPNLCILVTSHGGHIGFLEGKNPFGTNYVERVFQQFAKMMFDNQDKSIASPVPEDSPVTLETSCVVEDLPMQSIADIIAGITNEFPVKEIAENTNRDWF